MEQNPRFADPPWPKAPLDRLPEAGCLPRHTGSRESPSDVLDPSSTNTKIFRLFNPKDVSNDQGGKGLCTGPDRPKPRSGAGIRQDPQKAILSAETQDLFGQLTVVLPLPSWFPHPPGQPNKRLIGGLPVSPPPLSANLVLFPGVVYPQFGPGGRPYDPPLRQDIVLKGPPTSSGNSSPEPSLSAHVLSCGRTSPHIR